MKKIFILFCTLFALTAAHAQCPQYLNFDTTICGGSTVNKTIDATILESRLCGDSLTIVFDDSTTSLNGSSQVYFHTGPEFIPFEGWQNAYTQNARMQKIGTHLWTITFNPRSFYGYSPDSCLNAVACGFTDTLYANYVKCGTSNDIYIVTATGTAVNTCATATFFTATYTHAPVSYLWSDANTTGIRTFTTGGTYTVTASGVGGCSVTGSVTINLDNKKVSIGDDTIECTTSSYTFVATPGFRTYQWLDAAASASNTHIASNPTGGMYWVQAVDSFGCVSNDTASVHLSATGYLSLPATLSSCPGHPVSADASTNINKNGDSLVIVYNAAAGLTQLAGDTNVYFYSAPQFYPFANWPANDPYTVGNFTQNDGIGRMTSLGNNLWTITIDPQAYYRYSPDTPLNGIWMVFRNFNGTKTGKDSAGTNNNIFLYTVPNPPTSSFDGITAYYKAPQPLAYTWSNGAHTPADTFSTSGTYYVTVTDGVCTHSDSVVVTFTSSGVINLGADTTVCSGLDSVVISAGAGFAHYAWSNGATTASITVAGANTYTVTATSSQGCISTGSRKVGISTHTVSLGPDLVECSAAPVLLTATSGFVSYTWLDRAPSGDTLTARKSGTYWVAATDSFGCISHDTVSVRYSDVLLASLQDTFSSCPGNFVTLNAGSNIQVYGDSITILYDATQGQTTLTGDTNVYFYSAPQLYPFANWPAGDPYTRGTYGSNNGVGRMTSLGNNKWSITIFPQSYYGVSPDSPIIGIWMIFTNYNGAKTGKDANGNNIFVNLAPAAPTSSFAGVTAIHKAAGTLTYLWSNGATAASIAVDSSKRYTVTVSDGICSATASTFVNLTSTLAINIGNDTTICPSGDVTFNAGAGFSHYHWSTGDTTQTITVSAAGTYIVTVTNGAGCTGIDSAVVHVSGTKVNAGADVTRCGSLPVTLTASTGYASYLWFGIGTSSQTYSAVYDGCYWVKATDGAGCTSYDTVCVSTSGVEGLNSHDTINTCTSGSSTFDASVNVNAHGDSLTITFDATKNANSSGLLGSHKVYMHSAPQFYPFAPWPSNDPYTVGHFGLDDGLGEMDSVGPNKWQITIYPSCYYHFNPDTPLNAIWMVFRNANGTLQAPPAGDGNINLLLAGGADSSQYAGVRASYKSTGNITYAWSNGSTTAVSSFSASGTYYVTASDGTCSKIDSVVVNQNSSPSVNIGHDTCVTPGHTVIISAGSGYTSYVWNTGASTSSIIANLPGSYYVSVTNQAGCTGVSDTVIVTSGASVNLGTPTCLNAGSSYLLNATTAGANSYSWSTGATTDTLRVTAAGTYYVTVTESGCVATDSIIITSGTSVSLGHDTCINTGGSYLLSAGAGATAYAWSSGAVTDTFRVRAAGTYSVTVTEGTCTASDTVVISICNHVIVGCAPVPYFRVLNVSPANTVTISDSSYNLYGAVHYYWNFGDGTGIDTTGSGTQVHTYGTPDLYTINLTVCDSCGCDTFSKVVQVNSDGIFDINGLMDVNLYPNPASNTCTLEINASQNLALGIDVNNILGAVVQTRKWQVVSGENRMQLDVTDLASGMYTLTIRSSSGQAVRKLEIIK